MTPKPPTTPVLALALPATLVVLGFVLGSRPASLSRAEAPPAPQVRTVEEQPGPEVHHRPAIPDVELIDQNGRPVHFYRDLVQGHVVAINFVFTSCGTICPTMGAIFGRLEALLGDPARVRLISISIDPVVDTPARLAAWSARFHAGPGWTLLTGRKETIDALRKALAVFTPDLDSHAPVVLIGNDATGQWTRADGLAPATKLAEQIRTLIKPAAAAAAAATQPAQHRRTAPDSPAHRYFTDTALIDQDGISHRFYDDLVAGKVVVIDAFFTSCHGSCPVMASRFARIQKALGDRLEKDVRLISISVDATHDTPAQLKAYASRFGARRGWYFLTGNKPDVDLVLRRLGQFVEQKEEHFDLILVGNDRTGLWKKALGRAQPEEIIEIVKSVLEDRG
jgi:protein SCO1